MAASYVLSDKDTLKTLAQDLKHLSDSELDLLLELASSLIRNYTGRNLRNRKYSYVSTSSFFDTKRAILDGKGSKKLYLPEWPITQVDLVKLNNETIEQSNISDPASYSDTSKYKIQADDGYLYLESGWYRGIKNIHLIYYAGYNSEDYPENYREIDGIVAQLCAAVWPLLENSGGIYRDEKMGNYQYSIGYNAQYLIKDLTTQVLPGHPLIALALDNYTSSVYRQL